MLAPAPIRRRREHGTTHILHSCPTTFAICDYDGSFRASGNKLAGPKLIEHPDCPVAISRVQDR
jgi:hypothetical protein